MLRDWLTIHLLALCSLSVAPLGCAAPPAGASASELLSLLRDRMPAESFVGKHVYVAREPLPADSAVTTWRTAYTVPREYGRAWFYFIDDAPGANWEHPCRYVFVDVDSRQFVAIRGRTPPNDIGGMRRLYPER